MAGHPLLQQVAEDRDAVSVNGVVYYLHLTWHRLDGIKGYIVGLKFTDASGSMDSAKIGYANPFQLADAIGNKAKQILKAKLDSISLFGFYLLTDDLESRRPGGTRFKHRLYNNRALDIHATVKHKLHHLTSFSGEGGMGWAMSENPLESHDQFAIFQNELGKQLRVNHHAG